MSKYVIYAYAISDKGHVRENNEDNYLLNGEVVDGKTTMNSSLKTNKPLICAVCDGVGGEAAGEVASKIAVKSINSYCDSRFLRNLTKESVNDAIMFANEKICEMKEHENANMGSTIALVGIAKGRVVAANVGDSRIYKYSDGKLKQLSKDHTREQTLINAGLTVRNDNDKHILTQHLGIDPKEMIIEPFIVEEPLEEGAVYLLCSDGLYDMLSDDQIADILGRGCNIETTAHELVKSSLEKGGHDNITIILINPKGKSNAVQYYMN